MQTFIKDVIDHLNQNEPNLSELTFILPSKRAGVFLLEHLKNHTTHTHFSPSILSIEEFIEELSQLCILPHTTLLFEFYSVYKNTYSGELDSFDKFSKWAGTLLQDFNEIDRHLIEAHKVFSYLKAIQEINSKHWSLENQNSSVIANYLKFWNSLEELYTHFKNHLLDQKLGYQGLIYREAFNNLELYIQEQKDKRLVFLGFNALNTAERKIIQELLHHDMAQIFWDIDASFIEHSSHDAGLFIRQYKKWNYFKTNKFNWQHNYYQAKKHISVIGVPKQVAQAKYIGNLLLSLKASNTNLNRTAVVLGDETLIYPLLSSIPSEIDQVNITMGLALKTVPLTAFFNQLIKIQKNNPKTFYYKDVLALLSHPIVGALFDSSQNHAHEIIRSINKTNLTQISCADIIKLSPGNSYVFQLLFKSWQGDVSIALKTIIQLIFKLKSQLDLDKAKNKLNLEYLYQFHSIFSSISHLNSRYNYINSISTLYNIYNEILIEETIDFEGQPLKGLQIMGMLESRVLDFETVIISGVNEGILPAGKTNNSFIPFDVKLENGLPTYREKDAVYAYHFYHLIQRAKKVYILYNTEPDVLNGGEKSRFISQLEIENVHPITSKYISPANPKHRPSLFNIKKNEAIILDLKEMAKKGFSPSALLTYIRNPLDFYYQRILGIYEHDSMEETVEANTLGR
jgi:ATP-dependent helicase/nuclease subunit B